MDPESERGTTDGFWSRSVIAILVTVFTATCGSTIGVTALGLQVYDLTRRELDLGLLGLAEFAPAALLVLVTGSFADRYDRARIMSWSALAEGVIALGLAAYAWTDPTSVLPIFLMVLAFGVGRAFHAPAGRSIPADIVPARTLPHLTARRAATWQSAVIVGPVAAGFLYTIDPAVPYVAMAAMFGVAAFASRFVKTMPRGPQSVAEDPLVQAAVEAGSQHHEALPAARGRLYEAFEGLRFIRRTNIVLAAISLDLFAVLFAGAVALLPAIAKDQLGVGPVALGWLRAAGGIGAALVTLLIAWRPITRRVGPSLLASVAVFGAATIVLGSTRIYAIAFIAMFILSGADSISVFVRSTLVPLVTPRDKRGRVLAVESVFIGASNELGAFESGVAGHFLGASRAVALGGAATVAVAVAYWVFFPSLRSVDRFPEDADAAQPGG